MDTFHRNMDGYPLLERTPIDSTISNFQADGFQTEPRIVGWASYGRMKSILHRVLGKEVFDRLFRQQDDGNVNIEAYGLASTIVLLYVNRPDRTFDLQTTLIANLVAARCNLSVNHRAKAFSFCDKLVESCKFDREYSKRVKSALIDEGVLEKPWWSTVRY